MRSTILWALGLSPFALAAPANAQGAAADLNAFAIRAGTSLHIEVEVTGAAGDVFTVLAAPAAPGGLELSMARPLMTGTLNAAGHGFASFDIPDIGVLPDQLILDLRALYLEAGRLTFSENGTLPLNGVTGCQLLDFDYTLGDDEPVAGQPINDQWAAVGLTISTTNNTAGHPDQAIIFDSANPTGLDFDLATPGPGIGNDEAIGNLLIIAEDDFDGNTDGLVDDPDDESHGGIIQFTFENPVRICSINLVDIDDASNTELRFTLGDATVDVIPVDNLGNNSVQHLTFLKDDVVSMEVVFGGSGGIGEIEAVPCPFLINLDESPFGMPLGFEAGLEITDQYQNLGVTISATNASSMPGHEDEVILFDSENPTGGDFDLMTPGSGFNNDTALGLVLIIAENSVDADNDGLVDDPDDEREGGTMFFDFDEDVTFFSAKVLDVDGVRLDFFALYDANDVLIEQLDVPISGDNSVDLIEPLTPISGVRRIELVLGGSGAVTRMRWCRDSQL